MSRTAILSQFPIRHLSSADITKKHFSELSSGGGGIIWECVTINAAHLISVYSENKHGYIQLLSSFGTKRKFVAARETENHVGKHAPWHERAP